MKLRINAKLRAALIAAITAVGFTLTQAQAETTSTTLTTTFGNCAQGTATNVTTTNTFASADVSGNPAASITSLVNNSGGTVSLQTGGDAGPVADFLTPNSNVGNGAPWTLSMSYSNANAVQSISGMTLSVGLYNASGSWQGSGANWKGDVTFTATVTANGTSVAYTGYLFGGDSPNPEDGTTYNGRGDGKFAVTLTGSTLDLSNVSEYTVTLALTETLTGGTFVGLQNIGYNVTATLAEITNYVWHGTEGSKWSDSVWNESEAFVANNNAKFDNTASCTTVIIDSAVTAKNVTVDGAEYTFNLDGGNLTSDSLTVSADASLSLTGSGIMEITGAATITEDASLIVDTGASLKVGSGQKELMMGTKVTNNGTFVLTSNVSLGSGESTQMGGTLAIQGATVTIGSGEGTTASIASFSHVNLDGGQITVNAQNATINGVSVASGKTGTVKVEDMKNSPNTVTLAGITQVDGTLNLTNNWNSSFTIEQLSGAGTLNQPAGGAQEMLLTINSLEGFTGNLSLKHNKNNDAININTGTTAVNFNSLALDTGDHSANFTLGAATNIGQMTLTSGSAVFTGEHMLTVGGVTGAGSLSVAGDLTFNVSGTSAFTGTLAVGGQIVKQGTGSQTISGTALHHTLDVQAGTLVLNGNFAIDDVAEGDTTISYLDSTGAVSTNGFQKASGTLTVYNDHSSAGTLDMTSGSFTYGANDVTETVRQGNGVYTLSGEVDYATLYVNENTEALAVYQKAASDQGLALAGVVMKDATTLTVDADYSGTISVTSGKGKVNISEGKTLTGTKSNITLAGAGTYALNSGDTSLGGVTLDEGWTGVVRITDASLNNINLSGMRNAQSTVELKGFNGWTDPWEGTNGYNFKLTNGSNGYAWQNGAFGQNSATHIMEFTGVWSGDGLFLETGNTATRNMHYTYSGNIAAWTGEFRHDAKQDTNLTFKGSATNVNIAISKGASSTGVFNVVAGTTGVTFNKSVTADKLTVQEGATATFNGVATFGSVTEAASAGITVGTTGNLTLNGGSLTAAITNNGTLTFGGDITATGFEVNSGSTGLVDVEGKTDSGNGFETTSGNYIVIATNGDGATLNANSHKVTQNEVDYAIQADGTAVAAGGGTDYFTYYQTNGAVSTSAITTYAEGKGGVCMFAAVTDAGILNVDSAMGYITADGGEVVFQEGGETDGLVVSDNAKVSGLKDISIMSIEAGKTATMEDGLATGNVTFAATDGVKVTNTGEVEAITYSLEQTDAKVTADTMTVGGTEEVVVSNSLVVGEIINNSTESLIVMGNVEDGVTLNAAGGDILLAGQTTNTVSVVNLDIAAGKTVTVMDGDMVEGTVTVTDTLTGGDATLLANLTLVDGTTLDVNGGGTHALTLGSELTISLTSGGLVNLDDDTLLALNSLGDGETLNLIVALNPEFDALTYGGDGYDGLGYDELFSRIGGQGVELQGNYTVYAKDAAFGLTKQGAVPEPTTGTLSLLALMALAARRRRK